MSLTTNTVTKNTQTYQNPHFNIRQMKEYLVVYEVHDLSTPSKQSNVLQFDDENATFGDAHEAVIEAFPNSHIVVTDIKELTKRNPESN